jgi:predicted nucleic acid-binding protein
MRCFFDTNVLLYMFDDDYPVKKEIAEKVFFPSARKGEALLSTQVLQEFFVIATRKLGTPLTPAQAERAVRDFSALEVVAADSELILDAIAHSRRYRLSLWDSLIIQAALRGRAEVLYTEDLQNGQVFEDLTVRNPFVS